MEWSILLATRFEDQRNLNFQKLNFQTNVQCSLQQFPNRFLTFSVCSLQYEVLLPCCHVIEKDVLENMAWWPIWLSSLLVVSSSLAFSTFTLSMSRSSWSKDLTLKIFSDEVTSRSPIKNPPPLSCRHFHLSFTGGKELCKWVDIGFHITEKRLNGIIQDPKSFRISTCREIVLFTDWVKDSVRVKLCKLAFRYILTFMALRTC